MNISAMLAVKLLLLLLAANGSPILLKRLFGDSASVPLDFGYRFMDGRPLLGPSKTVRGFVIGIAAATAIAPLLGFDWRTGAAFGLLSMAGDLSSSFIKRRLNIRPSSMSVGLDQIPEALLPLWVLRDTLGLDEPQVLTLVALFTIGALLLSRLMYRMGVRDQPY